MRSTLSKVANALSFAHLARVGMNDEDKVYPPEPKQKKAKKAEADDRDDDKDERDGPDMESDTDDESMEDNHTPMDENSDEEVRPKSKKAKRARAADDDDDGDEEGEDDREVEMRGNSTIACARLREQKRCAAIFASPAAARNPGLAATLAFKTRMPRGEAIAVLESSPAAAAKPSDTRAARNPNVGNAFAATPDPRKNIASTWDAAFKSVAPRR